MLVSRLRPVALGVLGVLLALGAHHLYVDHQLLHVVVGIEAARQKAFQAQQEGK